MPNTTLESQGVTLQIGNEASPEVWADVANITSIDGPSGSASEIDITSLASSSREFRMGLPDSGNVQLNLMYDPADTEIAQLRSANKNRTRLHLRIQYSDSPATTDTFYGYVTAFNPSSSIDTVVTATATIRVDGDVTTA